MKDPKIIPLFKIDPKYADVPDSLRWAIPLVEAQNSPEVRAGHKASQERAQARIDAQEKARLKASFKIIS